ncbi:hypothetical protein AMAG_11697 [Allomyces macrogynus ATCC 38327]|uniref:Uncharacterized protein n=1 Tax=Allomyces macrogynus (strain ATCC 38327) TaxID=578462 RepID=A0A0L0SW59_ALLM3|nr:hypothetical protein AMAG_11697 [Allomyces macrogynus ATCC 38327]|eukprot:KNE66569.1 hypothetical protein AMAG_11697 [Allomyces macrogynus ATCC 38327]
MKRRVARFRRNENVDEFVTPPESPRLRAQSTSTSDLLSRGSSPLLDDLLLAYLAADSEWPSRHSDTFLPPPALEDLEPSSSMATTPVGSLAPADPETLASTATTPPALESPYAMHPVDSGVATADFEDKTREEFKDVDDALHKLLSVLDLRDTATPVSPLIKSEQVRQFPRIEAHQVVTVDEAVHLWTPIPVRFSWWKTAIDPWTHPLLNDIATRVDQRRGELAAELARMTTATAGGRWC